MSGTTRLSTPASLVFRYGVAVATVGIGLLVVTSVPLLAERSPFFLFFAAVIVTTYFAGRGPGIVSIILSMAAADYFLLPPVHSLIPDSAGAFRIGTFILLVLPISLLMSALRHREVMLTASRERYRFLFDNNPFPMWLFDQESYEFLEINDAATFFYGYSREEFLSMTIKDIRPAEDVPGLIKHLAGDLPRIEPVRPWRHVRKDGSVIFVETSSHAVKYEGRKARLVLASDVTDRLKATAAVKESEARLQTIIENLTEGIVVSSINGDILDFNRAALESHGFTSLEECKLHISEFARIIELSDLDGNVLPTEKWPLARILDGETIKDLELNIRRLDIDHQRTFNYGGVLVHDADHMPIMAIVTISDITEHKRDEIALRERSEILDLAPVTIRDLDDRIIFWNRGAERMYGWSPEEALGQNTHTLFQTIFPQPIEEIREAVRKDGQWEGELVHTTKNGDTIAVASLQVLHRTKKGEPRAILEVNNDITRGKKAEEEVRILNDALEGRIQERTRELESANKELETFSYSVSHDLRAPLRHVDGFVQLLKRREAEQLDGTSSRYLKVISDAVGRMGELIDELLLFSRTSRQEMHSTSVDLDEVVRQSLNVLAPAMENRKINLQTGHLPIVEGDPTLLSVVTTNLLSNAIKFTRNRAEANINVEVFGETADRVTIRIRDNGAGFDMEYADKLFGVFQRLHRDEEFEGIGIGLATVQRIVNRHSGQIWAEGEIDKGATFFVTLRKANGGRNGHENNSFS